MYKWPQAEVLLSMGTYGIETHDLQNVFHIWPVIVGLMLCCLALLTGLKEFRD